jgi:hypothetical protein
MSKKFYAVNRETKERWVPVNTNDTKQYLVMYDSGYLAVVTEIEWAGNSVKPLDTKIWVKVVN